MQEVEKATALFAAGGNGGPHALVITLTSGTARALRDASIDHAMANLLLAVIVRRLHAGGEHETKVVR